MFRCKKVLIFVKIHIVKSVPILKIFKFKKCYILKEKKKREQTEKCNKTENIRTNNKKNLKTEGNQTEPKFGTF
jgi:hypothetical protein